jgi:hypothetical protein
MIGFPHLVFRDDVAAILNLTVKHSQFDKRPANRSWSKLSKCAMFATSRTSIARQSRSRGMGVR